MVAGHTRSQPARGLLRVFLGALVIWLLVCLADSVWYYFTALTKGPPPPWSWILAANVPYWIFAAFLTPGVVWVARVAGFRRGQRWRDLLIHLVALIAFAIVHVALYLLVRGLQQGKPINTEFLTFGVRKYLSSTLDKEILLYLVIIGAVYAYDYYQRYRERARVAADLELERAQLKASLSEAQLEALKMQMQPHFLFNALHAISTLIMRGDAKGANQMLLHLSHFLRMTLDTSDAPLVPLAIELEFLDAYLRIQKVRFGDRLRVDVQIAHEVRAAAVPNLILQPLVENAIRHGIAADPGSGTVTITARRESDRLSLTVQDTGPGLPPEGSESEGVGLRNTRARLRQLYPDAHEFSLRDAPAGGTLATLTIPFRVTSSLEPMRTGRDRAPSDSR